MFQKYFHRPITKKCVVMKRSKAGRVDSSKVSKLDRTGLLVGCCRHGHVLGAIDMTQAETFSHVNFMHRLCNEAKCNYFCYDVFCQYKKFAARVGNALPQFKAISEEIDGYLPRKHAKVYECSFQVPF